MTVRILQGDCRALLASMPDASVHCCVTSPPYWGLRDYGVDGQIGLEESVEAWVAEMVAVFREVRRVLRDDGTLWLNLGDSYASNVGQGTRGGPPSASSTLQGNGHVGGGPKLATLSRVGMSGNKGNAASDRLPRASGLKPKDLIGQPWRVAFALQADGWWLRQDVIWHKPNPMPESIRDRCTKAHEYLFLLSKSERYHYDFDAMQEPVNGGAHARRAGNGVGFGHGTDRDERGRTRQTYKTPDGWDTRTGQGGHGSFHREGREKGQVLDQGVGRRQGPPGNPAERKLAPAGSGTKLNESYGAAVGAGDLTTTRNRRSVWTVPSEPFKEAHFATFPPALIEPCIRAGCPEGGTVLDPFGGAGTTGLVADRLQRNAVLCELNPAYIDIARRRIHGDAPLLADVEVAA